MSRSFAAYLPQDRRAALAQGADLPALAAGTLLFADISGFTPLTERLARELGPRRGAEALTRLLNTLYTRIITVVDAHGGSVIGFSGDAITCWFTTRSTLGERAPSESALRAVACAAGVQQAVTTLAHMEAADGVPAGLAVKIALASGPVRRFVVGDPAIQRIDVVAGATVDAMAHLGEQVAQGETRHDDATAALLLHTGNETGESSRHPDVELPALDEKTAVPWVHPLLRPMIASGQERFLAELRPAAALFVRFGGLDFEADARAPHKLDDYVRWAQAVIARHEGLLIQLTTGDKGSYFYAAFGAPVAHENDAQRAVTAALELLYPPAELDFVCTTQIGASLGQMRVGAYGSVTRCTYGVLGDNVNVAARLMAHAAPGQILVTEELHERVRDTFACRVVEKVQLKGKSASVTLYEVTGRAGSDAAARLSRLYANPLVGREGEMERALDLLRAAAGGSGHILQVEGPAGIGKSHFAAALVERAQTLGLRALPAGCQASSAHTPYAAARQWAIQLLGVDPSRAGQDFGQLLAASLRALGVPTPERAPLLGDLLGTPIPDNELTTGLEPRQRQSALSVLFGEIVEAAARVRPLLLVVDDAHWLDEASQQILLAPARSAAALPLLLLLVHRPVAPGENRLLDEIALAGARRHFALGELNASGVALLLAKRLGAPLEPLAVQLIQAQAQGNPFFCEELSDALRDAERLHRSRERWLLSAPTLEALRAAGCLLEDDDGPTLRPDARLVEVDLGIPGSVQGVVLARLDRLPDLARLTLKVASVVGRVFALPILQATRTLAPHARSLPACLSQALERDFVRMEDGPRAEYLFKHNIIREVAYGTLLEEQQQEIHEQVAQAIEARTPDALEELAHHFSRSNVRLAPLRAKALHYLILAGQRAQRDYANETALVYYGRAAALQPNAPAALGRAEVLHLLGRRNDERAILEKLDSLPDAPPIPRALLWGDFFESVGDFPEALQALNAALRSAQAQGDSHAAARALVRTGMVMWRQGDYPDAQAAFENALAALGDHPGGPSDEEADAWYGLGLVYRQTGRFDAAEAAHKRDLALRRTLNRRAGEARTLNALGHVESMRQNHRSALAYYEQALAIRRAIGERAGIGASLLSVAQSRLSLGEYAEAEPLYEQALRIQQETQNRWEQASIWNELGILRWMVGQYATAQADLARGMEIAAEIEAHASVAYLLCNMGQVQRDAGNPSAAAESLRRAGELARELADPSLEAMCNSDLALTLLQLGAFQDALALCAEAERLFRELEQPDPIADVESTRARALLGAGQTEAACEAARRALALLDGGAAVTFPHHTYLFCGNVLHACGDKAAADRAWEKARTLLNEYAARISSIEMHAAYHAINHHRAILATA